MAFTLTFQKISLLTTELFEKSCIGKLLDLRVDNNNHTYLLNSKMQIYVLYNMACNSTSACNSFDGKAAKEDSERCKLFFSGLKTL